MVCVTPLSCRAILLAPKRFPFDFHILDGMETHFLSVLVGLCSSYLLLLVFKARGAEGVFAVASIIFRPTANSNVAPILFDGHHFVFSEAAVTPIIFSQFVGVLMTHGRLISESVQYVEGQQSTNKPNSLPLPCHPIRSSNKSPD